MHLRYQRKIRHDNDERERERRTRIYIRQWARVERKFGPAVDSRLRAGSAPRPVWSDKLDMRFSSASRAAIFVRDMLGKPVTRSDIRNAIVRGGKTFGLDWRYCRLADQELIKPRKKARKRPPVKPKPVKSFVELCPLFAHLVRAAAS